MENLLLNNKTFQKLINTEINLHNISQVLFDIYDYYNTYYDFDTYEILLDRCYNDYSELFGPPINLN